MKSPLHGHLLSRISLVGLALAASVNVLAQPAAEGLTPEESNRLRQCRENLAPSDLLPDAARSCAEFLKADGGRVLLGLGHEDSAGLWDDGKINFSLAYLEAWMKKSNLTSQGLLADKNSLAGLARVLAPVLVNEGTHQTQDAFFKLNGISDDLVNVEEEVGAAVNSALFVEENFIKRGARYVSDLSELDNRLVGVYRKKGVEGIRHDRERTYLNLGIGSKFPLDRTTAMAFGNEWMQKDYKSAASYPKDSSPHRGRLFFSGQ